ncbi:hypothetical protein HDV06_006819 [Boothiomyces sp. JEL0866]|nr:hypothetical protein HDV06_006819 [Boothiomyces sp. JEL0866]
MLNQNQSAQGEYNLVMRQAPEQAESCLLTQNEKDRNTLEPAVVGSYSYNLVEVIKPGNNHENQTALSQTFLFGVAVLVNHETLEEIRSLEDKRSAILAGSTCSSILYLMDPEKDSNYGAFLVFSDLSIRKEGRYKLKIVLYKIEEVESQSKVVGLVSIMTDTFTVLPSTSTLSKKKAPPVFHSKLSRSFLDQGLKIKSKRQSRSQWLLDADTTNQVGKRKVVPPKSGTVTYTESASRVKQLKRNPKSKVKETLKGDIITNVEESIQERTNKVFHNSLHMEEPPTLHDYTDDTLYSGCSNANSEYRPLSGNMREGTHVLPRLQAPVPHNSNIQPLERTYEHHYLHQRVYPPPWPHYPPPHDYYRYHSPQSAPYYPHFYYLPNSYNYYEDRRQSENKRVKYDPYIDS